MDENDLETLAARIAASENAIADLKPGNAARLHFADTRRPERTPLALVYLHGFSGSPGECAHAPETLGAELGANTHVVRLPGHGRASELALQGVTADDWLDAAQQALNVGKCLGERVVLAGTSMGASLAFAMAAERPSDVAAVLAWSLGARAFRPSDLDAACALSGVVRDLRPRTEAQRALWSTDVHSDGHRALRDLFSRCMTPANSARISAAFLLAYHFEDEETQDRTASVPAMLALFEALGTPATRKRALAFANGAHAIASPWRSPAAAEVLRASRQFVIDMLGAP